MDISKIVVTGPVEPAEITWSRDKATMPALTYRLAYQGQPVAYVSRTATGYFSVDRGLGDGSVCQYMRQVKVAVAAALTEAATEIAAVAEPAAAPTAKQEPPASAPKQSKGGRNGRRIRA